MMFLLLFDFLTIYLPVPVILSSIKNMKVVFRRRCSLSVFFVCVVCVNKIFLAKKFCFHDMKQSWMARWPVVYHVMHGACTDV